jgi:hypothetical protein
MASARDIAREIVKRLKQAGFSPSDPVGPHKWTTGPDLGSYSFWIFRDFAPDERGSKTKTHKSVSMLRVNTDGTVHVEREDEAGTRSILGLVGVDDVFFDKGEKKPPRAKTGMTYSKASSQYGASMGRSSDLDYGTREKLRLERVPLDAGGYDPGGAYWGGGVPLYIAYDEEGRQLYFRARDREAAKAKFPNAKFHR